MRSTLKSWRRTGSGAARWQPRQFDVCGDQCLNGQLAGQQPTWRPGEYQILSPQPDALRIRQFQPANPKVIGKMAGEAVDANLPAGQAGHRARDEGPPRVGVGPQQQAPNQDHQRERGGEQAADQPAGAAQKAGNETRNNHQNACPIPR